MDRIRQLRTERGLSQAKLAVMAGMDPATFNRLEQGKGNPNLRTLERVADALGVSIAELLESEAPKAPGPARRPAEHEAAPAGPSDGWAEAYAAVGRELLRGWEKRDQKWDRILQAFVNSLPEERRAKASFSRILLIEYLDWIIDTGGVVNTYVEGVLGKHAAGVNPDLDEVCDQMLRLWPRISSHGQALSHSVAGEDDPEVAKFREQLEAQGTPDFEARYRKASSAQGQD
jgi:transcriptional regulator with XRE-family HTH domain